MSRILISGDSHLGCKLYGEDFREKDHQDAFEELIDKAIEKDVDKVIHAGDLFHSSNPSSKNLIFCMKQLIRLREEGIEFCSIVGNHEKKLEKQWLDLYKNINSSTRLGKEPVVIDNSDNVKISIYGVDSINNSWWENIEFEFENVDDDLTLLVMHELFNPPVPEHKSDHDIHSLPEKIKNIDIDVLVMGDFHKFITQHFEEYGFDLIYPGPTEKTAYNQDDPGFVIMDVEEDGSYTIEREEIENSRDFLFEEVEIDEYESLDKVKRKAENIVIEDMNKKPILIVDIHGELNNGSMKNLQEDLNKINKFKYVRLNDRREDSNSLGLDDFEIDSSVDIDIDSSIESKIDNSDLSEDVKELDNFLRNYKGKKTEFREKVREKFKKGDNNED